MEGKNISGDARHKQKNTYHRHMVGFMGSLIPSTLAYNNQDILLCEAEI